MTTDSKDRPTASKSGMPSWLKRVILFASLGAVLVIVYFILAAFVPRWWAEQRRHRCVLAGESQVLRDELDTNPLACQRLPNHSPTLLGTSPRERRRPLGLGRLRATPERHTNEAPEPLREDSAPLEHVLSASQTMQHAVLYW